MKLTRPQFALLETIRKDGPTRVARTRTAQALVARGFLVQDADGRYRITEQARNALWAPQPGDLALFLKSGAQVTIQQVASDQCIIVKRVTNGKELFATRAGLVPVPVQDEA